MGQILSGLVMNLPSIATNIAGLVTNVATTAGQLSNIITGFTAPELHSELPAGAPATTEAITDQILMAMGRAETAALDLFGLKFPGTEANSDKGVVDNFCGNLVNADLNEMIEFITLDFKNWQIVADDQQVSAMAKTIALKINAQMGKAGTAYGTYRLNMNQKINWTLAYGEFVVSQDDNGVVYAFAAAQESSFFK